MDCRSICTGWPRHPACSRRLRCRRCFPAVRTSKRCTAAKITSCSLRWQQTRACRRDSAGCRSRELVPCAKDARAPSPWIARRFRRSAMTTSVDPHPDPAPIIELIEAFRRSQTMFTALSLGVFEALHAAPGDAASLASRVGAHAGALARLLDGCAALGLLEKREGIYSNSPAAERYLCAASPHSLRGYVQYSHDALYAMWAHLDDAVREGSHRWGQAFGLDGPLFSHFFRTDAAVRDFLMGMHGFGMLSSPKVAA